mmetsp:Transcript_20846/g.54353  ORF Transcript_20846/g.54353 Transcript_20846/m.54353 type:complete len:154 (-) Transcript_20846:1112-1573(-)|eukprot:1157531-Pelagomonas_calceolata.AAC.9
MGCGCPYPQLKTDLSGLPACLYPPNAFETLFYNPAAPETEIVLGVNSHPSPLKSIIFAGCSQFGTVLSPGHLHCKPKPLKARQEKQGVYAGWAQSLPIKSVTYQKGPILCLPLLYIVLDAGQNCCAGNADRPEQAADEGCWAQCGACKTLQHF